MAMVRFATTCDISTDPAPGDRTIPSVTCGARSAEYDSWPRCRYCSDHCCPRHQRPNSQVDAELDEPGSCVCIECAPEDDSQMMPGEAPWDEE